ncbi:hypothetical protein NC653_015845 [Populus alba x Populus x berolinensis]|uniref:Uncharacterized protein n=1 Tax=Populus alba x Populus x berolinensis TaxID=444605 RepID=A0AAD6QLT8_9ROSI|nr:hypothetical protein NC653_015845 [Populus alba x Populus x berolinensis]
MPDSFNNSLKGGSLLC